MMFFCERLLASASFRVYASRPWALSFMAYVRSLLHALSLFVFASAGLGWSASGQAAGTCEAYGTGTQVGTISEETLAEASGLAASHINPGIYWTLNDSGSG